MTDAPSRWTTILGPLLVVGVTYLYFFAGGYYGIYDVRVRISSLVFVGVVMALFAIAALRSPRWFPVSRIWPALAIGIGVLLIATVFSRNPRISLDFVAYAVLLAGLYLLLRALLSDGPMRNRLGVAMVILAFAIDVAYLAAVASSWRTWWEVLGRVAIPPLRPFFEGLTYGNPGMVAAMAVLTSLSATAQLGLGSRRAKGTVVGLWVLTAVVVIVTGTRSAWIALAVTAAVAVVLGALATRSRSGRSLVPTSRAGRAAIAAVAVVGLLGVVVLGPALADRLVFTSDGGRLTYWAAALRMFGEAPLTGVGPGMWAPQRILHTNAGELDFYIPHAHNLYLQTASELGLQGIVGGLIALIVVVRLIWPAFRGGDPTVQRWAVAAVLAAVYFGSHQLFDLLVNMPAALFVFAFPIAWLDANAPVPASDAAAIGAPLVRTPRARALALGVGVLAVGLAVVWAVAGERSALKLDEAKSAFNRGDWAAAAGLAADAVAIDPTVPPNQLLLALSEIRQDQVAAARPALDAVAGADGLPPAWVDLAWLDATAGDADGARAALAEGMRLGRQQPAIALAAGRIEEILGDTAASNGWYTTALTLLPRLAADPYWQDPQRSARMADIEAAAATAMAPKDRVDLFLSAGDDERARAEAASIADPAVAAMLSKVVSAWTGDTAARDALEAEALASPRNVALLAWCARLADRAGDHGRAEVFRYLANIQSPQAGLLGTEVAIVNDVGPSQGVAGTTWVPYGIYTYRRPTPGPLLLPGMPQIVWATPN